MPRIDFAGGLALFLVAAAAASAIDLHRDETHTLVVYTTPALKEALEGTVIPSFEKATGIPVEPVYMAAGAEYNRVRMSRDRPEADLFLHASPLFIERGAEEGYFATVPDHPGLPESMKGRSGTGLAWFAFAWSPLVTVHREGEPAPDLADLRGRVGLPHPRLSNNGVYAVVLFDGTDPAVGTRALNQTVVQPTNASTNISGVADGSFDVTLGYEAVALFFQGKGAKVGFAIPEVHGERVTTPVLFAAGLLERHPHAGADSFVAHLLSDEVQQALHHYHLRPARDGMPQPRDGLSLEGVRRVEHDWSRWEELEGRLQAYEVRL